MQPFEIAVAAAVGAITAVAVMGLLQRKIRPSAVITSQAPSPAGHYAQGVIDNGVLYISGQLPIDPADPSGSKQKMQAKSYTITEQTRQALSNVKAVLDAAGGSMDNMLKTTVYVSDVALWPEVNAEYSKFFTEFTVQKPARAVVPVTYVIFMLREPCQILSFVLHFSIFSRQTSFILAFKLKSRRSLDFKFQRITAGTAH
jgi:2-iminobutanoate/2-iminopropanoate deaminase